MDDDLMTMPPQALLESGLDVNATYEHDLTLLMWAAGQGHADVARLLLARGARPEMRDDRGLTASEIARMAGHEGAAPGADPVSQLR